MRASKHEVQRVLNRHIGRDNAVTAEQLALEIGLSQRGLRKRVSELREDGVAVAAHPTLGYFIAVEPQDLELCCAFLRSRAMHSLHLESRLRNIPLPDLLGQLRLRT